MTVLAIPVHAQRLGENFKITGQYGELWYGKNETFLGKYQRFYRGWAEGVFYSCNYAGQSYTHTAYSLDEFLDNKEFRLVTKTRAFKDAFQSSGLIQKDSNVYVHRITCNGKDGSDRRLFYPFITVGDHAKGLYIYEGAVFILETGRPK